MSEEGNHPTNRSRTEKKTQPRGSIALEDDLWEFVLSHTGETGLSKNAVYRKALLALKRTVEGPDNSPSHNALQRPSAADELTDHVRVGPIFNGLIPDRVSTKIDRLKVLRAAVEAKEFPENLGLEFRALRAELIALFQPLLERLIKAKLLMVSVHLVQEANPEGLVTVFADPNSAERNSNLGAPAIWIGGTQCGGSFD